MPSPVVWWSKKTVWPDSSALSYGQNLFQYSLVNGRFEGFLLHQVNANTENGREITLEVKKPQHPWNLEELYQHIEIAPLAVFTPNIRTEQAERQNGILLT